MHVERMTPAISTFLPLLWIYLLLLVTSVVTYEVKYSIYLKISLASLLLLGFFSQTILNIILSEKLKISLKNLSH